MKKTKIVILFTVLFCSLFNIYGCKKNDDKKTSSEVQTQPVENLSTAQLYDYLKVAYTNRKIYDSSFTQKHITYYEIDGSQIMAGVKGTGTKEVSYNNETNEGYVLVDKVISNTDETSKIQQKEESYIVKEYENYVNYYTELESGKEFVDVFYSDQNELINKIKDEYTDTEEKITFRNPNQYTTVQKYSESLIKIISNDIGADENNVLVLDKYTISELAYANYSYKLYAKVEGIMTIEFGINYTKNTVIGFSYKIVGDNTANSGTSSIAMKQDESLEYIKEYNSSKMNFDKTKFNTKVPGEKLEIDVKLQTNGMISVIHNFDEKVKVGENILMRLASLHSEYSDEYNFVGWYYDDDYVNKVGVNDVFMKNTKKIYGLMNPKVVKEGLTATELYQHFKTAYANRNLYNSDFYVTMQNEVKISLGNGALVDMSDYFVTITYNKQTNEGYIEESTSLYNDVPNEFEAFLDLFYMPNNSSYIVKSNDQYYSYYSESYDNVETNDIFIVDNNYLINEIKNEYSDIDDLLSDLNPSSYSSLQEITAVLKQNDSTIIVNKAEIIENEYNDYTLKLSLSKTTNNSYLCEYTINFDKNTILSYSVKFINEDYEPLITNYYIEYSKEYDSEGMDFQKNKFNGINPGVQLDAELNFVYGSNTFFTATEIVDYKVKQNFNIINSLSHLIDRYCEDGYVFQGWYYDKNFTDPVLAGDIFGTAKSLTLYAKLDRIVYSIEEVQGENGMFFVANEAGVGDEVYVNAYADSGYEIDEMYYMIEGSNDKYYFDESFTMPDKNITVYVTFKLSN